MKRIVCEGKDLLVRSCVKERAMGGFSTVFCLQFACLFGVLGFT